MNVWEFINNNLISSFILSGFSILVLACMIVEIITQTLRHWNIHKHGYPPKHCDSDGKFKSD